MNEFQDQELNDDELDAVVGGVPPEWAANGNPDNDPGFHGGWHVHGKPNSEDLFEGTTDSGL